MSIIEDALKRAGAEEVKVEDLRPGDKFVMREEGSFFEGTVERVGPGSVYLRGVTWSLSVFDKQRWYLVERAPVEEPTGWGAIVEVDGVKYSRVPYEPQDANTWVGGVGSCDWEELIEKGAPKILFEGISE